MAKIKITLTEDHIMLIKNFKFKQIDDNNASIDIYNPYDGTFLMEDLALIFGKWDKFTPGTENDYDGKKYGLEVETEMLEYHTYIVDNIEYILSIIIQFVGEGIKPGVYSTIDYKLDWTYSELKIK